MFHIGATHGYTLTTSYTRKRKNGPARINGIPIEHGCIGSCCSRFVVTCSWSHSLLRRLRRRRRYTPPYMHPSTMTAVYTSSTIYTKRRLHCETIVVALAARGHGPEQHAVRYRLSWLLRRRYTSSDIQRQLREQYIQVAWRCSNLASATTWLLEE
jgi:hypothetical protein